MYRKLLFSAFLIISFLAFSACGSIVHADEFKTLSDSTKIYDIVKSPWTQAKKAEITAAIDLVRDYDKLEKVKWYDVFGYYGIYRQINEKRKKFYEASKQRILLEEKMKREGTKDLGQTVYNAIITGADMWARYANNDGPIFSQMISSYDNLLLKIVEYDKMTWMTPIKKAKKFKEVKDSTKYVVQCAKRFEQSNTFDKIKAIIDHPQGKEVINVVTGIGGLINSIGDIFKGISSIGGIFSSTSNGSLSQNSEPQNRNDGPISSYDSPSREPQELSRSGENAINPSTAEFYTQKHRQYISLVEQYYEALKAGKTTEELSGQFEEINRLKQELGIK
ncbi:MAG TPA: hypothetical protein PKL57_16540 [Candidatus Wallbacteria bacterium]|nr:hypothetical protein [Candidatus Wallbacteria bacterium]